jgi:hypothetical protein
MCQVRSARGRRSSLVVPILRYTLLALLGLALAGPALAAPSRSNASAVPGDPRGSRTAELLAAAPGLDPVVLDLALEAYDWARVEDPRADGERLAVIDYSLPSTARRLWVFDVARRELVFHELVAHGIGTGDNLATRFSNVEGTRASSLGIFRTGDTYQGRNGYSLRLHGLEPGVNDQALARTIVMHGAWYVSAAQAKQFGRLGRSWGCPAVRSEMAKPIIDFLREGNLLFVFSPQPDWLRRAVWGGDRPLGVSGVRTAAR